MVNVNDPETWHPSLTPARIERAVRRTMRDEAYLGFCVACGRQHSNVEPDACGYPCTARKCHGSRTVYGAEELLFRVQA